MQKLINDPADAALESLRGLQLAYPHLLRVQYNPHVVIRKDAPVKGKVAVISGSGSGHEPLNVGYVGKGMLDAACPGAIFTSPTPDQYLAATRAVDGGAGALYIVKNYTGGVLNTDIAQELALEEGYTVASVLVHDDVAVDQAANRRGMGAAVLVEKIAGAAAEAGKPLAAVARLAHRVAEQARSMGVALSSCTPPSVGHPTFQLPDRQIELGVGIHGEPGRRRMALAEADTIVDLLAAPILDDLELRAPDTVLAMVSGLGGTPQQELYIVYRRLHELLTQHGIRVERSLVGNYVTSLDMAGCTVTLLRLDPELLALWDAPVRTPALCW
ncbi:MAG: dihydroxyacetone kinase subunit DhaK [Chloroflexi bacterium]|nr:MAG: dihydroxyacetone kinase subunit DhaK [Chloroflexota bacterium]